MQRNNIFYETGEIDYEKLSPYERFQLEKYGNILSENQRPFPFSEMNNEEEKIMSTQEESYIFSLENSEVA